jgi:alkylation response protein AidB-like acyl-CoA dehydrogenase
MSEWPDRARAFADDYLFPTASQVDAMDVLPRERLDRLAAEGYYGLAAPGHGIDSFEEAHPINEALAGGCMTTMLVLLQHMGPMSSVSFGPESVKHLLAPMAAGDLRATVAFAGLLPEPKLRARPDGESWVVDGVAPWVSGWGLTDLVALSARTEEDDVVWLLADTATPGFRAEPHRLLALSESSTVTLQLDGVRVGADRLTSRFPWSEWPARDAASLRMNGSMALGVAVRCTRLLGSSPLDDEVVRVRAALDAGDATTYPTLRAEACALAVRAAAAAITHTGSSAVDRGRDAERLYREAGALLVFGSRPAIRSSLLTAFGAG